MGTPENFCETKHTPKLVFLLVLAGSYEQMLAVDLTESLKS